MVLMTQLTETQADPLSQGNQKEQFEVSSIFSPQGTQLIGYAEAPRSGSLGFQCVFKTSSDRGKTWSTDWIRKNPSYDRSLNPAVAADLKGTLYAACLSAKEDYSSGVIELSRSTDRGFTWSAWKPVVEQKTGIPDKPSLFLTQEGHLILSFSDFEKLGPLRMLSRGLLLISKDQGESWSKLAELPGNPGLNLADYPNPRAAVILGEQGISLAQRDAGDVLMSWGTYSGDIRFSKSSFKEKTFSTWQEVAKAGVSAPVTQILYDPKSNSLGILWYGAHSWGEVSWVSSSDGGRTWASPVTLSENGSLASGLIDSDGRLHLIWSENLRGQVGLKYATSHDLEKLSIPDTFLAQETYSLFSSRSYLGAYQSLILTPEGNLQALWISGKRGFSELFNTSWKTTPVGP